MTEVTELIDGLKEHGEKPLEDIKLKFTLAVVNSLWSLCTGIKYKQNDEELIKMTEDVNKFVFQLNLHQFIGLKYLMHNVEHFTRYKKAAV